MCMMIFRLFLLALWLVMFKNWSRSSSLQSALRTYFAVAWSPAAASQSRSQIEVSCRKGYYNYQK